MRLRRILVLVALLVGGVIASPMRALAQQVDVIRGHVVGADSAGIENVRVTVTSISGTVSRTARSDKNGRFTVTFPNGDGDYMVYFAAIGYAPKQFEVKRTADQDILIADTDLSSSAQVVDAIEITAPRQTINRNDNPADISGSERAVNPTTVPATQAGDLASAAASLPGVTFLPGEGGDPNGFSVLGLGADQNNATLNGVDFGGSSIPRDASVSTSVVTTPYDVTRGGFSGAQTSITTRSGSNIRVRGMSVNLDAPPLQWTDDAAAALGTEFTNISVGGLASGPIEMNKSFYNTSVQLGRRMNDLQTLLNTSDLGLTAAGIAPDSVDRFMGILQAQGIPATAGPSATQRIGDNGNILGAFDLTPPSSASGSAYNLAFNGSWNKQSPATGSASELPSHSGDRTSWGTGLQGRHSGYFRGILTETTLGFNTNKNNSSPYLSLPSGRVRVNSSFPDGSNGVQTLQFGGSPSLSTSSSTLTANYRNQLSWFSRSNRHRLKLLSELRYDDNSQDLANNLLGTFTFNSLSDFESGTPASFTRQITTRRRSTGQIVGGLALGDSYRRNNDVQFQYGIRLDGNKFTSAPTFNPAVEDQLTVRNDYVPNRIYVSPRFGFSWTYGAAPQIAGFAGAVRGPRAVVRGGIGLFQNTPSTMSLGSTLDNTGLPSAVQQLNCVGSAAPTPDWNSYLTDLSTVPSLCANGTTGTVFANSAPNVTFFAKDFQAPRSVRSNLTWTGAVLDGRFNLSADVTYSLNLNQPQNVDVNFVPNVRFTLPDEAGRPVFVLPSSIVAGTGTIASGDARFTNLFSRVTEMRSNLRSDSRQLTLRLNPYISTGLGLGWSMSYVYSDVREQVSGFSSTVGNPFDVAWANSGVTSKHQISYTLNYSFFNMVRVSWNGSFRSGTGFTPTIAGDVNGDGYTNDRAFIFNPATATDPSVAAGMQTLLTTGSSAARKCLTKQLGQLASRNSCDGPWTSTASMSITLDPVKFHMPHRATLNLSVSNPLGAADLVLHGSDHLRGWGQPPNLDPSLLYVRGFDSTTNRFAYEVNQRFGTRNTALNGFRAPVTVTALIRFDIGPVRERQNLNQLLTLGRSGPAVEAARAAAAQAAATTPAPAAAASPAGATRAPAGGPAPAPPPAAAGPLLVVAGGAGGPAVAGTPGGPGADGAPVDPALQKYPVAGFKSFGSGSVYNPFTAILRTQDTLQLSGPQADSIAVLSRIFTITTDSMWGPTAEYLSGLPDIYSQHEAFDRYVQTREQTIDLLAKLAVAAKDVLTPSQRRKLPAIVANYMDPKFLATIRSGTGVYITGGGIGVPIIF